MEEVKNSKNENKRIKDVNKPGSFTIQSGDSEYSVKDIKEMCVKAYGGDTRKQIH